jgi:hypothetical protein
VDTANVAVVEPAATVTAAGTDALLVLLESATTAPPEGAAALNVTVPVLLLPAVTVVGLSVMDDSAADVTALVTEVVALTVRPTTANVALCAPAGTVTLEATVAMAVLPLVNETLAPPVPAGPERVTVPVAVAPEAMLVGETLTLFKVRLTAGAVMVNAADWLTEPTVAVTFAVVALVTEVVATVNVVELCPAGTVIEAGTVAVAESL